MKTIDEKEKFVELRAKGVSFEVIAKELGVSKQTLINWSRDLAEEINNFKTIEVDAIREKYLANKQSRVEMFGVMLKKIREELEKRDLSTVATPQLVDMLMKFSNNLRQETDNMELKEKCNILTTPVNPFTTDAWKFD